MLFATPETVRDLYAASQPTGSSAASPVTTRWCLRTTRRSSMPGSGSRSARSMRRRSRRRRRDIDEPPAGVVVRRATADDVDAVVRLDLELSGHQRLAPVFSDRASVHRRGVACRLPRGGRRRRASDPARRCRTAASSPCSSWSTSRNRACITGLARPERAAFLGFAATLPEARGTGAGVALTNAGLAWARDQGYPVTVVDWRETNLLASRFWPRRGFRRTFLRLYRSIP